MRLTLRCFALRRIVNGHLFGFCLVEQVFAVDAMLKSVVTLARTSPVGAGAFTASTRNDEDND